MQIHIATSAADVERCYPVMHQLRPHLERAHFVAQVQRQRQTQQYTLAYVADSDGDSKAVRAVAGYRWQEKLSNGRCLYVDDLVTDAAHRSQGYGEALLDWLIVRARAADCATLLLDSGVQRRGAHRFYFRIGMHITGYHFIMEL